MSSRQFLEYHPMIGFRFIPGLRARVPHEGGGYLLHANEAGFRCDREFVRPRRPGFRRVLLFGDSFTAGDGVSNGQRYGDALERLVPHLEVYNFGLPGTGTDQQYLAYREYAAGIEHDLLVIGVLVENIRRVAARYRLGTDGRGAMRCYAKPYYELAGEDLVLRNVPVPREPLAQADLPPAERANVDRGGQFPVLRRVVNALGLRELAQRVVRYQPTPEYDEPHGPAWLLMRRILQTWIAAHPCPVLLVPLPLYQFIEETADPSGYRARFRELADACGCALHDPLDDLRAYPRDERVGFRFRTDVHLSPAGHEALARSLAPAIGRLLDGSTKGPGQ